MKRIDSTIFFPSRIDFILRKNFAPFPSLFGVSGGYPAAIFASYFGSFSRLIPLYVLLPSLPLFLDQLTQNGLLLGLNIVVFEALGFSFEPNSKTRYRMLCFCFSCVLLISAYGTYEFIS